MKDFISRLAAIREALTKERPNSSVDGTLDWLTFLVSLTPVPGVAESAAIANKVMNDRALNSRFDGIVAEVSKLNGRIQQMESGLERVELIRATAKDNAPIHSLLTAFFDELKSKRTEFSIATSDWSTQAIINTLVSADWVNISAVDHSRNLLDSTHVAAQKTSLVAKGGSQTVVRDSSFTGDKGSVTMSGEHSQAGKVSLSGPSVTYEGPNSRTEMDGWSMGSDGKGNFTIESRGTPFLTVTTTPVYTVRCPRCSAERKVEGPELQGKTHLSCAICGKESRLPPLA